jgi:hypothetical protein
MQANMESNQASLADIGKEVFHIVGLGIDKRIETVTGAIEELSQVEPKCRRLMSVPGIGPIIATGIVAAIGRGEAFERGRDFAAWLGLVPRQHSTGGRTVLGRISKRGSKYLRTLLIQAAKVLLMRPHNWSRYSFGAWLKTASQRLHKNKLAVALANKLARIAWSVLHNEKAFDAFLSVTVLAMSLLGDAMRRARSASGPTDVTGNGTRSHNHRGALAMKVRLLEGRSGTMSLLRRPIRIAVDTAAC